MEHLTEYNATPEFINKIYMVSLQSFFKEGHTDYAMAVDFKNDTHLFFEKRDALAWIEGKLAWFNEFFDVTIETVNNAYIITNNFSGTRTVIEIHEEMQIF